MNIAIVIEIDTNDFIEAIDCFDGHIGAARLKLDDIACRKFGQNRNLLNVVW